MLQRCSKQLLYITLIAACSTPSISGLCMQKLSSSCLYMESYNADFECVIMGFTLDGSHLLAIRLYGEDIEDEHLPVELSDDEWFLQAS